MKKNILIVEDDALLLESIKFGLENKGYCVEKAQDGWDALNILEKNKVDLIISDIMMPNISGLSLLSVLNKFHFNRIPIIMISSLDKASIIMSAMGLGAYDFIVKPINFNSLYRKVSLLLKENKK